MSYQTCEVSTSVKDTKTIDLKNANKAIRKLKTSEVTLNFTTLAIWKNHQLWALVMLHLQTLKIITRSFYHIPIREQ